MDIVISGKGDGSKLRDADDDTKVDVEEGADEDKVRMDVAGVEAFLLHDDGILTLAKQSGCYVGLGTDQSAANETAVKIQLDTESFDTQGEFDPVTNHMFTAKKAGTYLIVGASMIATGVVDGKLIETVIFKNGVDFCVAAAHTGSTIFVQATVLTICQLVADDYIELYIWHNMGGARNVRGLTYFTFMTIAKLA